MQDNSMIINPAKGKGEPDLPAAGLFLINPAEAGTGLQLAKQRGGRRHFLFNSGLALIPETMTTSSFFTAGPSVGAPMAVLTLEKLIALGARRIIVYGWCGSLNEKLHAGDLLLPTWAVSDESTSRFYPVDGRPESHGPTRQLLRDTLTSRGFTVRSGPVWTTDAPYRESIEQVQLLGSRGILGVDMEFAALAVVAAFRKVHLAALLLVSDELWSGKWQPGFQTKNFKAHSKETLEFLFAFCQTC
jgi:purine-nucleoside phosphorylase